MIFFDKDSKRITYINFSSLVSSDIQNIHSINLCMNIAISDQNSLRYMELSRLEMVKWKKLKKINLGK